MSVAGQEGKFAPNHMPSTGGRGHLPSAAQEEAMRIDPRNDDDTPEPTPRRIMMSEDLPPRKGNKYPRHARP